MRSPLGPTLKAARERRGWTREALAYHSGLSAAAIAQIESGRRRDVRLTSLAALAAALEVPIDHLAGAAPTPPLLEHRALTYEDDPGFLAGAVPFLGRALADGATPLAVVTAHHREILSEALGEPASRVEFHDAAEWCETPAQAFALYREALERMAARGSGWVWILAEPVWPEPPSAEFREWARYESLVNIVFASAPASVLCAYDAARLPARVLDDVRCAHPGLVTAAGPVPSDAYRDPADFLAACE